MTNPQLEDGYTRIANELLEAFCLLNLSAHEFRTLMAVIRKTYGYQKKKDKISLSQLSNLTRIGRTATSRAMRKLEFKGVIVSDRSKRIPQIELNKKYVEWNNIEFFIYRDSRPWYRKVGICEFCRNKKTEACHHIIPKEFGGKKISQNGMHVCNDCHDEIHQFMIKNKIYNINELQDLYNLLMKWMSSNQITPKQMSSNWSKGVIQPDDKSVIYPADNKRKKETIQKKHSSAKPKADPRVREAFNYWDKSYKALTGEKYLFSGAKEGSLIKKALATYDKDKVFDFIDYFFKEAEHNPDCWWRDKLTISSFYVQIPKIIRQITGGIKDGQK